MNHRRATTTIAGTVLALLGIGLTGCGSDEVDGGPDPSAARTASNGDVFTDEDVAFATEMIPHHAQAIEMVILTDGRTLDPEVKQLADGIRSAQAPEVETMVGWLTAWGEEIPETSIDHANAGHHGDDGDEGSGTTHDMPGMMSESEMDALASASDAEFQDEWLEMMIRHHEGAIEMAEAEQDDGRFEGAIELAGSIATGQRTEIDRMKALLAS